MSFVWFAYINISLDSGEARDKLHGQGWRETGKGGKGSVKERSEHTEKCSVT